jgi:hypothetical protein
MLTTVLAALVTLAPTIDMPRVQDVAPQPPARRAPAPAAEALAPLAFLAGHWVTELPNGMVSEESWLPARGKSMLGSFRQTRPDGKPAFFEFSQIVVEGELVVLRQIHVHGGFDTDPRRKDPMMLRLLEAKDNSAVFVPVDDAAKANAGDLSSIRYTRTNDDTLALRVESKPVRGRDADETPKPVVIDIVMKLAR